MINMTKTKNLKAILLGMSVFVVIFLILTFQKIIHFIADYKWFVEVGYEKVFLKRIIANFTIGGPILLILTLFLFFYILGIKRSYYRHMNIIPDKAQEKKFNKFVAILCFLLSLIYTMGIVSTLWIRILSFFNSEKFKVKDPIFSKDIGFYIFKLPLIDDVFSSFVSFLVLIAIITVIFYFIMLSIYGNFKEDNDLGKDVIRFKNPKSFTKSVVNLAMNQFVVIGIVFFVILAIRSYLQIFSILYSHRGFIYGASYTDVHVNLWSYKIQMVLAIFAAIMVYFARKKSMVKWAIAAPIAIVVVSGLTFTVENIVQNYIVVPNEITKERPYIKNNMKFTSLAYGLDNIKQKDFNANPEITKQDLVDAQKTIENISINDLRPTKEVYNQIQGIRTYYKFEGIDVDRYLLNGKLTQVFLSARELDKNELKSNTWMNRHIKYTHGYGIAASSVNKITQSGQPNLIVQDFPPKTPYKELKIKAPQIYFGELTDDFIITNTSEKAIDYPNGETNALTQYKGKAGISLSFGNRLLYTIQEANLKLMLSSGISKDSKIILNRNIIKRVEKIAPFLQFDQDPYLVVADGKLIWMIDGYTLTNKYPYSKPFDSQSGVNYIRNSFKVTVDAYDGDVNFYIVDEKDPIIKTYDKIFKGLFKPMSKMPNSIKSHMRYPIDLFKIQANIYQQYHMRNADVFYNKEDMWQISKEIYEMSKEPVEIHPSYGVFKLPEEKNEEFLLNVSYTPSKKANMVSFMVARNDGKNYGELICYRFPKNKTVFGPLQVENMIANTPAISTRLTQWDSGGSKVLRGHLLTIPVKDSILYIEPLYIKSSSDKSIPEVKRVIVSNGDTIVMEETLQKSLESLFGYNLNENKEFKKPSSDMDIEDILDSNTSGGSIEDKISEASKMYQSANEALKQGDLKTYADYIEKLGKILNELDQLN